MTGPTLLLGAIVSAGSCLLCLDVGGISLKDTLVLPAYARKDVVYRQHRDVIYQLEKIIKSSHDFDSVESRIRATFWPEKVLQISLSRLDRASVATNRGGAKTASEGSCYTKTTWTNLRSVIRDGSGYGSALTAGGPRDLLIVDSSLPCAGRAVAYTIFLEQPAR